MRVLRWTTPALHAGNRTTTARLALPGFEEFQPRVCVRGQSLWIHSKFRPRSGQLISITMASSPSQGHTNSIDEDAAADTGCSGP